MHRCVDLLFFRTLREGRNIYNFNKLNGKKFKGRIIPAQLDSMTKYLTFQVFSSLFSISDHAIRSCLATCTGCRTAQAVSRIFSENCSQTFPGEKWKTNYEFSFEMTVWASNIYTYRCTFIWVCSGSLNLRRPVLHTNYVPSSNQVLQYHSSP